METDVQTDQVACIRPTGFLVAFSDPRASACPITLHGCVMYMVDKEMKVLFCSWSL